MVYAAPARKRNFCISINNPTELDYESLTSLYPRTARFIVYQTEKGNKENTTHIQAYVQFSEKTRFTAVKKIFPRAHIEEQSLKASVDDNIHYCSKADTRMAGPHGTLGKPSHQGCSNELSVVCDLIGDGMGVQELWREHRPLMVRHHRGLERAVYFHNLPIVDRPYTLDHFLEPKMDLSKSVVLNGPSGIGKTQFALAHFSNPLMVRHKDDLGTFERGVHDGIIFDDMCFAHWPRTTQIHITDMDQPSSIDIKYGRATIPAYTPKIFTTNNLELFDLSDPAIARRVKVKNVTCLYTPPEGAAPQAQV